jgi:O-succinylbenzoic acid--CoA ligase
MLSADALLASAAASESALGGSGQWLLALPAHYIAGINVLVRSLAARTEPAIVSPEHFGAETFLAAIETLDNPRRLVSLVPTQLSRLLQSDAATDALRSFAAILVGGQSMPSALADHALEKGLRVVRTYGSSETCGGCVYDGVPIGNTKMAVVDGRVELAGSVLAEAYLDDPRRTAYAFREHDGHRWYHTDDIGTINGGRLEVTGRVDDLIISGGIKVSLSEVEGVVRGLVGLADAVVVSIPQAEWGEVPFVVTTGTMPLDALRDAVSLRLGPAAAPARILKMDALPTLATGKPDRLAIAALALSQS